jgi:hypothetical protein
MKDVRIKTCKYFVKRNRCKIKNMEGHRGKRVRWDVERELE